MRNPHNTLKLASCDVWLPVDIVHAQAHLLKSAQGISDEDSMNIRSGRLQKIVSAWVDLVAVFRADSEYHIKKILKNGLEGRKPFQILGLKLPFFGPPENGSQIYFTVPVIVLIH